MLSKAKYLQWQAYKKAGDWGVF